MKGHLFAITFILSLSLFLGFLFPSFLFIIFLSVMIILGALIIAWAAEASEYLISQSLALVIVALLQVFPEFMIEATISWAQDIPNMLSNFTGANRILVGVGWPLVFFVAFFFFKRKTGKNLLEIRIGKEHSVEVVFFMLAIIYCFIIYLKSSISVLDSFVLAAIFSAYIFFISKLPHASRKKNPREVGEIPKKILGLDKKFIIPAIVLLFFVGGALIFLAAEPFYTHSLMIALAIGVPEFLFIQWVAPFLSEFPEKTSAFYWASKIKTAPLALMNLITSKLSQLTLLLAMIPAVYSASLGRFASIPLGTTVGEINTSVEFLLTIMTALYACVILLKLRITWSESLILFGIWVLQFLLVWTRPYLVILYFILCLHQIFVYRNEYQNTFRGIKELFDLHVKS